MNLFNPHTAVRDYGHPFGDLPPICDQSHYCMPQVRQLAPDPGPVSHVPADLQTYDWPVRTVKQTNMMYVMSLARKVIARGSARTTVSFVLATQYDDREICFSFSTPPFPMIEHENTRFFMAVLGSEIKSHMKHLSQSGVSLHHVKSLSIRT